MSESGEFFKPADSRRELWAKRLNIDLAAAIMQLNPGAILNIEPGGQRTLMGSDYRRVRVTERRGPSMAEARSGKTPKKSVSDPLASGATKPFELVETWLHERPENTPSRVLMNAIQSALKNPFENQSYPFGALSAIKIQISLELDRLVASDAWDSAFPRGELIEFVRAWRERIAVVNSEPAHQFEFLCTECGGFSKMVMGGKETGQTEAAVGNRMMMKDLGDLPGPWQNHYAAVIMTDQGDRITLESAAGMDDWWFGLYGDEQVSQTFIVKTLITKLQLGKAEGEVGSAELEQYVQAVVAKDPESATLGSLLEPAKMAAVDKLLDQAGYVVGHREASGELAWLKEMIPAYRSVVAGIPETDKRHKPKAEYLLARGITFYSKASTEKDLKEQRKFISWAKKDLTAAHDEVITERMDRDRAMRWARGGW